MTDDSYRRIGERSTGDTMTDTGSLRRISEGERPEPAMPVSFSPKPAPAPASASASTDAPSLRKVERSLPKDEPLKAGTASPAPPAAARSAGRGRWFVIAVVAIVVAVVLAAGVVWLAVRGNGGVSDSMRSSAQKAASGDAGLLASYDYRNLTGPGSAWSKVEKQATPAFKKSFLSTSGDLGKLLTQYNATATAKVLTTGISSITSKRAVVLVFLDQTVTNQVQKSTNTSQPLRVEIVLSRQGGKWLVDNLQVPK